MTKPRGSRVVGGRGVENNADYMQIKRNKSQPTPTPWMSNVKGIARYAPKPLQGASAGPRVPWAGRVLENFRIKLPEELCSPRAYCF